MGKFLVTVYTVRKSRHITGQNRSPIFWYEVLITLWKKKKRTPLEDFNYFSTMFYHISTTYQKLETYFALFIFLDFCIVWVCVMILIMHWKSIYQNALSEVVNSYQEIHKIATCALLCFIKLMEIINNKT